MSMVADLSDNLAAVVESVGPSVVRIEAGRRARGSGTVWTADGVIVTADHVIERDEEISVGLADGRSVVATLVGRDPSTDLAVLRAQATGLQPPAWRDPGSVKVGQVVLALGRPGRSVRARFGIVSAFSSESWRGPAGGELARYLEADLEPARGFSGGPLVDSRAQVLGVITSGLLRGTTLTVPVVTLRKVVETLLAHGRIRWGYLGVGARPVRLPERLRTQSGQEFGLIVISVEPGSPAERGGLLLGDIIVALGGSAVRGHGDLVAQLTAEVIGKSVEVRVVRGGIVQDFAITIGERP